MSGSNPKHTIYTFSSYSHILRYIGHCVEKKDKNKHKEARFGLFLKHMKVLGIKIPVMTIIFSNFFQDMESGVTSRFSGQPEMLKMFEKCRKKFTEIFPDTPPKIQKLNSPGQKRFYIVRGSTIGRYRTLESFNETCLKPCSDLRKLLCKRSKIEIFISQFVLCKLPKQPTPLRFAQPV